MKSHLFFILGFLIVHLTLTLLVSTHGTLSTSAVGIKEVPPFIILLRYVIIWPLIGLFGWIQRWFDLNLATLVWFGITIANSLVWAQGVWLIITSVKVRRSNGVASK